MGTLRFKLSTLAVVASFAVINDARAADLPVLAPVVDFSGWYLRGDIGFSNQVVGSLFNQNYSRYDSVSNVDRGFDAAPLFGLGVGYNINNWLRVDLTGEYRGRANFHGLDVGFTAVPGAAGNNFWPDRYTGSKYEWTFLLNGYIDLGDATTGTMVDYTFSGFDTPFEFHHLTSQDLRLGLRYNFGAFDVPPPPPPLRSRG